MVNTQKVKLKTKDSIESRFTTLKENFTPVNVIHYIDYLQTQPVENILENAKFIFIEPTKGAEFLNEAIQFAPEKSVDQLSMVRESIVTYYNKAVSESYDNKDHLSTLNECVQTIDTLLSYYSSNEYLKESMLGHLYESYVAFPQFEDENDAIVTEGLNELADGAEKINLAINRPLSRAGVSTAHAMMLKSLSKIKTKQQRNQELIRVQKMIKNTEAAIATNKRDQKKIDDSKGAHRVLAKTATALLNPSYTPKGNIETLEYSVKGFKAYVNKLNALPLKEHIGTMAPDIIYGDEEFTNVKQMRQLDFAIEFVDTFMDDSDEINLESFNRMMQAAYDYESLMEEGIQEDEILVEGIATSLKRLEMKVFKGSLSMDAWLRVKKEMDKAYDTTDYTDLKIITTIRKEYEESLKGLQKDLKEKYHTKKSAKEQFKLRMDEHRAGNGVIGAQGKLEESIEIHKEVIALADRIIKKLVNEKPSKEKVTEGAVTDAAKKVAIKANEISRKTASGARRSMDEGRRVKVIAAKIPSHFEVLVNNTIDRVKNVDVKERRKRIIEGSFRLKLFKLVRNAILFGAAWAVNPALAGIGLITTIAFDKQVDEKVREQILREMESEHKLVLEKIEDARGDQNKQKKYQLMRIKDKLERDIDRIKFRLDKVSVSSRGVHL